MSVTRDNEKKRTQGQADWSSGVDSGNLPHLIQPSNVAFAINATFRGGVPDNRPPYALQPVDLSQMTGKFQGCTFYTGDDQTGAFLAMVGGRLWKIPADLSTAPVDITPRFNVVTTEDFTVPAEDHASPAVVTVDVQVNSETLFAVGDIFVLDGGEYEVEAVFDKMVRLQYHGGASNATVLAGAWIDHVSGTGGQDGWIEYSLNPATSMFAWLFQAENYGIVLQDEMAPIIYDGSSTRRSDVANDEIPPGYIAAYVNGRIWLVRNNRSQYIAGDIVGGSSGTVEKNFRDGVLKFTENTFLNEGGAFSAPANSGPITSIGNTANLDTSLGQGVVMIGSVNSIFTCNAPVDRTTWKDLTYPIQTITAVDYGPLAPRALKNVNADAWFRALDGWRSWIIARRNFNQGWGNSAMSHEVSRILDYDTEWLLPWVSAEVFDNRQLMTVSPFLTSNGVVFRGLVALAFDEITSMRSRDNPAYDGLWTGVNIYQLVKGKINGVEHCWAFVQGQTGALELWEILTEGRGDTGTRIIDGQETVFITPIQSTIEGGMLTFNDLSEKKQMDYAVVSQRDIQGTANFRLSFKPDDYPIWTLWDQWTECSKVDLCTSPLPCPPVPVNKPGYRPWHRTPMAPETALLSGEPANLGYGFQWRLDWEGKASPWMIKFQASAQLDDTVTNCQTQCRDFPACEPYLFGYASDGLSAPAVMLLSTPQLALYDGAVALVDSTGIVVAWRVMDQSNAATRYVHVEDSQFKVTDMPPLDALQTQPVGLPSLDSVAYEDSAGSILSWRVRDRVTLQIRTVRLSDGQFKVTDA